MRSFPCSRTWTWPRTTYCLSARKAATCVAGTIDQAFAAALSQIGPASSWVSQTCRVLDVPGEAMARLDICVNEVLANILSHGGAGALAAPIRLQLSVARDHEHGAATLTIRDQGIPFDSTCCVVRPVAVSLADAQPGGLGVVMLRANGLQVNHCWFRGKATKTFTSH